MPRTSERGGPQTRARIADAAASLFAERGFDAVTVAEVARAAGVSSVTVFKHFPRKEDLYLDRTADAVEFLHAAVRDRAPGADVLDSLRAMTLRLLEERHPLSGVNDRSIPFFGTVAASPTLIARAREIAAELQRTLTDDLTQDPTFKGDPALFAAFFIAGYSTVLVNIASRRIADPTTSTDLDEHRASYEHLFTALRTGVAPKP
ncbi:TetR/AcrR family transcriptional regulator [Dactylosporangium sp. NPDC051541]|uniref:TetR/AcrR family transcriptional regulator n=1 Tax=Dactylosporangium sp. NPDC051541 TaxID=3363977 RepID=UPI0037924DB3